jgi:hypothetical protein
MLNIRCRFPSKGPGNWPCVERKDLPIEGAHIDEVWIFIESLSAFSSAAKPVKTHECVVEISQNACLIADENGVAHGSERCFKFCPG